MFKKKKPLPTPGYVLRLDAIERSVLILMRETDDLRQRISTTRLAQADAKAMDALTAMMSELARRVDLAGIAELPNECKCEACGCKNIMVAVPKAVPPTPQWVTTQSYTSGTTGTMMNATVRGLDAYCVVCKEKREMVNGKIKVSDSGRRMAQGNCVVCNTKVNRIMGKDY